MNWFLLAVFVAIACCMIAPAFWRKEERLQFPCLAGFAVLLNVALPLASLMKQEGLMAPITITRFAVMAILCLAAAWAGYKWPKGFRRQKIIEFHPNRLLASALILSAFGFFFSWKLRGITPDIDPEMGGMTGAGTIYLTLAIVARYGFVLAAILMARTRKWTFWPLLLPQLYIYFQTFLTGRRSTCAEIVIFIFMLLFFYRRWVIPMPLLTLGVIAAAAFSSNIGEYRSTMDLPTVQRFENFIESNPLNSLTLSGMDEQHGYIEIFNGANFIQATVNRGHYSYGLYYWNKIVFGYVPAQFLGQQFKQSLMIPLADNAAEVGFAKGVGSCETGVAEAFMGFGYWGCLLFFVLGAFMRWMWEGAVRNSVLHQFLFMLIVFGAIMTFSQVIWALINTVIHMAIFAGPLLWWSRVKSWESPAPAPLAAAPRPPARRFTRPRGRQVTA